MPITKTWGIGMDRVTAFFAGLMIAVMSSTAWAQTPGQSNNELNMSEYGVARAPIGYRQFCRSYPSECEIGGAGGRRITLTEAGWAELNEINSAVNTAVVPVTDAALYGVEERWAFPHGYGDCEDYVLLKRRMLMDRGWPAESLLITVVREPDGEGHAVLTVVTDAGDLILDNQAATIVPWHLTPYTYEKRQSPRQSDGWVWLRADRPGVRPQVGAVHF